jgi:EAL domain-containing protein (putative c-di-GMP-specific phosphodiesterase class I)
MFPIHGEDEQSLMKNADAAMYTVKESGKNNYQIYSDNIQAATKDSLELENSLRSALERDEFRLHYQAKLDLVSGKIKGVEALLRWQHPTLGMILPDQFISLAEETGLISSIGKWVLATACMQNAAWHREGLSSLCMSVNISGRQFNDSNLVSMIEQALTESKLPPNFLELELTENMVMQDDSQAMKKLASLKSMGVRIAIDNFGIGYSSLAKIRRFPIDAIKIDHSFIKEIDSSVEDQAITAAIISMGKMLDMKVIAGGVETEEQESFLRSQGCDQIQGFYFGEPVPADQFLNLIKDRYAEKP